LSEGKTVSDDFLKDPELVRDFVVESEEALQRMDQDMVALESSPSDADLLNRIFRAIHTIKGTAGFFGIPSLSSAITPKMFSMPSAAANAS
jgi:two-component system chemotaxis sensor kinase CheA